MTPLEWMMSGDTGVSSKTIMHVMEGTAAPSDVDVPHDPSDFGRCHRLLEAFPAYAARLGEVAAMYPAWVGLVREWDALTEMYCVARNTGAERATELYNRMEELIADYFKDELCLFKKNGLSSVTLKLPKGNSMQAGFYYTIMKELSWEGINLTEVISSTNEFTVVVDNALIDKTFVVLKNIGKR